MNSAHQSLSRIRHDRFGISAHPSTALPAIGIANRAIAILACALLFGEPASAGKTLDYIRNYDLNDFALGIAVTGSQNPYVGGDFGTYAYPYLTSFRDGAFTDDWLVLSSGNLGVRWVGESGLTLGALGRIQTLGFSNNRSDDLLGVESRKWAVEIGPTIGWRAWPVHLTLNAYTDISGHHDGLTGEFSMSLPKEWPRGYLIPSVDLIYRDSEYMDYYFGITENESLPNRPYYSPDEELHPALKVRWGYQLSPKWLLSGSVTYEMLGSEATNSPIVAREDLLSARVGLAYNANIFQPREGSGSAADEASFEIRIGAFYDLVDSKITRDTENGVPGFEIDVEDFLGAQDENLIPQIDAIFRIGYYHRLEAGYFEIGRTGSVVLEEDLEFGDSVFPEGTLIENRFKSDTLQFNYVYSLMKDSQKEFGFLAGLHVTSFDTVISADSIGQRERSSFGAPLPVIGLVGSLAIGQKSTLAAELQFFSLEFDEIEGLMTHFTIDIQRRFGDHFSAGIGYNFYRSEIRSSEVIANGKLELIHQGPVAFFALRL